MMLTAPTSTPAPEAPVASGAETPAAVRGHGPSGSRFGIRGDIITAATAELPERQRVALRWLAGYCQARNLSHRDVAPKLRKPDGTAYAHDSLYHALTGGRTADQLENIVAAIEKYRTVEESRGAADAGGFVEWSLSRRIFEICNKAIRRRRVCFIWGKPQIGKTKALVEFARRNNHGQSHYVRIPVGGGYMLFLRLLATSLHLPVYTAEISLRQAILAAVDDHMLIIVDEMHECFGADGRNKLGVKVVNFLREIYDAKRCGVVLCGTSVFQKALFGHFAENLEQMWKRSLIPLQCPAMPSVRDMAAFAAAFGLDAAPDKDIGVRVTEVNDEGEDVTREVIDNPHKLQVSVLREHGLGRWCTILEEAVDLAAERKRAISWALVVLAWHSFRQLETMPDEAGERREARG